MSVNLVAINLCLANNTTMLTFKYPQVGDFVELLDNDDAKKVCRYYLLHVITDDNIVYCQGWCRGGNKEKH